MLVKMLASTFYDHVLKPGEEVDVPDEVAHRWDAIGIASIDVEALKQVAEEHEAEENELKSMSAKQLYELCIQNDIETEPKLQKAVYINLLEEAGVVK